MKLSSFLRRKKPSPYGLFPWHGTWEEAKASATGYATESIAKAIAKQHETFLKDPQFFFNDRYTQVPFFHFLSALSVIFWQHHPAPFRVLDFGGSSGWYCYLWRRIFPGVPFDWVVVETEPMCKAHRPYEEKHLRWRTTIPEPEPGSSGKPFDLALASGCLMYLDQPYDLLTQLARQCDFLFVNRIPILQIPEDRIALQRIPPSVHETSHAFRLFSGSKMMAFLSSIGRLRLDWDDYLSEKRIEGTRVCFKGYLIETSTVPS